MSLADVFVNQHDLRDEAIRLVEEWASAAPLAAVSIRETLREEMAEGVEEATHRELQEQSWLMNTGDAMEGMNVINKRRKEHFQAKHFQAK